MAVFVLQLGSNPRLSSSTSNVHDDVLPGVCIRCHPITLIQEHIGLFTHFLTGCHSFYDTQCPASQIPQTNYSIKIRGRWRLLLLALKSLL